MAALKVLVADIDPLWRALLARTIERDERLTASAVNGTLPAPEDVIRLRPNVVVLGDGLLADPAVRRVLDVANATGARLVVCCGPAPPPAPRSSAQGWTRLARSARVPQIVDALLGDCAGAALTGGALRVALAGAERSADRPTDDIKRNRPQVDT